MEGTVTVRKFDPEKLRRLRRAAKMTQPKMAERSGVPLDTYRDYEQGKAVPSVPRLFILADTLRCSLDDLASDANGS
jgi:transcriptional regulator with XRE-family HTH domain